MSARGTTNGCARGSVTDRRARRAWVMETFGVDGVVTCYRCAVPLLADGPDAFTVDRIIPGCLGGTYRRENIRPACPRCNYSTGAAMARKAKS